MVVTSGRGWPVARKAVAELPFELREERREKEGGCSRVSLARKG